MAGLNSLKVRPLADLTPLPSMYCSNCTIWLPSIIVLGMMSPAWIPVGAQATPARTSGDQTDAWPTVNVAPNRVAVSEANCVGTDGYIKRQ